MMTRITAAASPPAPSWLDRDAADEWRRLIESRGCRTADPLVLASYCSTLALWRRLSGLLGVLSENGAQTWNHPDGTIRQHPAVASEARLVADLVELAGVLGLEDHDLKDRRPTSIFILDEGPPEGIAE